MLMRRVGFCKGKANESPNYKNIDCYCGIKKTF